jgi:predicted nucleic acid-binding protein
MNGKSIYLDSSAFVKLVWPENESAALRKHLANWPMRVSAALLKAEVIRAVQRAAPKRLSRADLQLAGVALVRIEDSVLEAAGRIQPATVRTLDAIHIATALTLGAGLGQLVTYDVRMATAARQYGLQVVSPS